MTASDQNCCWDETVDATTFPGSILKEINKCHHCVHQSGLHCILSLCLPTKKIAFKFQRSIPLVQFWYWILSNTSRSIFEWSFKPSFFFDKVLKMIIYKPDFFFWRIGKSSGSIKRWLSVPSKKSCARVPRWDHGCAEVFIRSCSSKYVFLKIL